MQSTLTDSLQLACEHHLELAAIFAKMAVLYRGLGCAHGCLRSPALLGWPIQNLGGGILGRIRILVFLGNSLLSRFLAVPSALPNSALLAAIPDRAFIRRSGRPIAPAFHRSNHTIYKMVDNVVAFLEVRRPSRLSG